MSTLSRRDQRLVLALAVAAVIWRWLVAMRTPMPGLDACGDLWLAAQLGHGHFGALATRAFEPLWGLLLAPAVAAGVTPLLAAQVAACLLGGLVLWPVAIAAERLREGAGLPAAVLAMVAAGPVVAAGAGSSVPLDAFLVALATRAACCGRAAVALLLGGVVALAGGDVLTAAGGPLRTLRLAVGSALLLAPLAALAPRPRRAVAPAAALLLVLAVVAATGRPTEWWPAWSPTAAVLAGVGLARLSTRWRDVVLCAAVAVECHGAWNEVERRDAITERAIGRYLARHLQPGQRLVSDLPRVLWAAGQRPERTGRDDLVEAASEPGVAALVLAPDQAGAATLAASLAGSFARYQLPADLADLVAERGLRVLIRR